VLGMSAITFYGGLKGNIAFKQKVEAVAGIGASTGAESVAAASRPFAVTVRGPAAAIPGAPNDYAVAAVNDENRTVASSFVAVLRNKSGKEYFQTTAESANGREATIRIPALPDVPTIDEAGVPGFDAVGWTLICAPAATPKPIVERLNAELKKAAAAPEVQSLMIKLGTVPVQSPAPAELQKFLASEIERWGDLIKRAGVANTL